MSGFDCPKKKASARKVANIVAVLNMNKVLQFKLYIGRLEESESEA